MSSEYLRLYETFPQSCAYLEARESISIITDPTRPVSTKEYACLIDQGFRRSGSHFYRPNCPACQACVSVRIPVHAFEPRRGQQRIWRRNADLQVTVEPLHFSSEHWDLYQRYQHIRHPGEGMDTRNVADYYRFIVNSPLDTRLVCFRSAERLLAVAVADVLPHGLSAVYTFYDPREKKRALGVHAVLWQIEWARRLGLAYVYLGYWIENSPKMAYKINYQPLEGWVNGIWQRLPANGENNNGFFSSYPLNYIKIKNA